MRAFISFRALALTAATLLPVPALSQGTPGAPPAVGVVKAEFKPMAESTEINGRIQARYRVDLVARVTAFLNERLFMEGADVKKGQILYRLERAPFEAEWKPRKRRLPRPRPNWRMPISRCRARRNCCRKNSGTQVAVDSALATQRTAAAQVKAAEAQLHQSQINLGLHRNKIANRWPHRSNVRSRSEMSSAPPAARWRRLSVRIRCT